MNLSSVHSIHFIGIGGIGMSALARYFHAAGKTVTGYDRTATELTNSLAQEGMAIHYVDDPQAAPAQVDLVVYTPAVPKDHRELHHFRQAGIPVAKRSEVLGWVTREARTIAVAGTHGKTTTSSIIAHLLTHSKAGCTAFLGGIVLPYQTNLLLGSPEAPVVVEADEYDRSFLALHPDIAIITSMDADHLDIYGAQGTMVDAFTEFAGQLKPGGQLILHHGLELANPIDRSITTYGLDNAAQVSARNIRVENGQFHFEVHFPNGVLDNLAIGLPGRHNIDNAVAAIAVARSLGLSDTAIREALATFEGVKRRFEFRIRKDDLVFIDDYAHHPTELTACIQAVRELFPTRKITGVFQPHLYSRTRDFEDDFARSLELLDELILLDIYPAREAPITGVTSAVLLEKVQLESKVLLGKKELVESIADRELEVLLTLGAGDIDQLLAPMQANLTANLASA